ncbi:unnamed protein product [Dicrocoelium dendriticum]|nr:unnamed protein product [Dicrocoelium dendriticum]
MDELEAAKAKQHSLRERLAARREQRQNLLARVVSGQSSAVNPTFGVPAAFGTSLFPSSILSNQKVLTVIDSAQTIQPTSDSLPVKSTNLIDQEDTRVSSHFISSGVSTVSDSVPISSTITSTIPTEPIPANGSSSVGESAPPKTDLKKVASETQVSQAARSSRHGRDFGEKRKLTPQRSEFDEPGGPKRSMLAKSSSTTNLTAGSTVHEDAKASPKVMDELVDLLAAQTAREKESNRAREEILELLNTPSTKERYLSERFRSQGGSQVQQFCAQGTRIECSKYKERTGNHEPCTKLHFRKMIRPHTDESLGDCSFLNTCFHVDTCKYVHYTIDYSGQPTALASRARSNPANASTGPSNVNGVGAGESASENDTPTTLYPPQWINCDIRLIDMSVLGKFAVIMADPPWDIHMELPYGTMSDDEMRRLDIPCLQDDGYIFLWVTGRAMELGRECLRLWGYKRVDEIIWVKTNQLQRLIRTGRTGHWLNHGKEHCLVGVKGNPQGVNRGLDCDVIVSEVRETSHKPDEIYGIIERLSPGTRKLELFGRPHNLQPNWITLGNQLDGTYLVDPTVVERFKKQYPNGFQVKET